jgi:2-polyprenyl-3-methyl-5-hydroxy-6-metoxy-1,4-benzoquinol methylase
MLRPEHGEQWERFGRLDPYYGVYAVQDFRGRELASDARARFFASGEEHVASLLGDIRELVDPGFAPGEVLDYGCGVGRLLIPLAKDARRAVGIDVSPSMLAEARRNCEAFGVGGVELLTANELHGLEPRFDLVHSALVLQHVPVRTGERIVAELVNLLRPGGVGAIHLQIGAGRRWLAFNALMKLPMAHNVLNAVRGRPWSYPHMQMNVYPLGRLSRILRDRGISLVHLKLAPRAGGYDACTLIFRR